MRGDRTFVGSLCEQATGGNADKANAGAEPWKFNGNRNLVALGCANALSKPGDSLDTNTENKSSVEHAALIWVRNTI